MKDPFTGEMGIISIDRTGHNEKKLVQVLANPDSTRDQKDHALSMYLYEHGKHNVSMLVDLMRYKGAHTKESRLFQSRMRLDFETFVGSFTRYLNNQSRLLGITLGIDIQQEKKHFSEWLEFPNNKQKGYTYKDYYEASSQQIDLQRIALIEMAIYALDEAEALKGAMEKIIQAREAMKGGGVFVDKWGRIINLNDPELADIIQAEREAEADANKDDEYDR